MRHSQPWSTDRVIALAAALLFLLPLLPRTLSAAESAWKVLFNGQPSQVQVEQAGERASVPVSFPVEAGETTWEVTLKVDEAGRTVQIVRSQKKPPVRAETCWFCSGDGDCRECYPKGSGKNTADLPCNFCNGTGKCDYCGGSGQR